MDGFGNLIDRLLFLETMSAQVFYDWVSADELENAHRIEIAGLSPGSAS